MVDTSNSKMNYTEFIRSKVITTHDEGFEIAPEEVNPIVKPHVRDIVIWMVQGGRRACFASFGLHKTIIQIEAVRLTRERSGGMGLIVLPLGVRQEFFKDANLLNTGDHPKITAEQREQLKAWQAGHPERLVKLKFVRRIEECDDPNGIYLTNYETVRDGKLDPRLFTVASLDEAAVLRGFGGTKTFREFMALFAGDDRRDRFNMPVRHAGVPYRFVATATPSPNEYIELLAYAAYLNIMDVSAAKTRFFKRDSTKADNLTIHEHKKQEFWLWIASFAVFIQKPSDLGYSDEGYEFPELDIRWHEVQLDDRAFTYEKNGQGMLMANPSLGVTESAREKRVSIDSRIAKMMELRSEDSGAHRIIWHDLESERHAIEKAVPDCLSVFGSQSLDDREQIISSFANGEIKEIAAKPVMLGSGTNLQRHCHWAIYLGIGHKFNDFIQSIHRLQRFLQTRRVRIDLIYTDAEIGVRRNLERKWTQYKEEVKIMTDLIKEFGLSHAAMMEKMNRAFGVERIEVKGEHFTMVNNDCVIETRNMKENSVGLIVTSIPFSTQYEYSPNFMDFGHTDTNDHFFQQMDFLTPELFRVLQPGRIAAIHVKDRIVPMGLTNMGFQTVYDFHCDVIKNFKKHGFGFMGMKTIVTDVVRENNQTYRLGWTEQCKDGTKMGVGMPEYLLIFRKPPTDTSKSYADMPVEKAKDAYSRARWQIDAHGFTRSDGNRLLTPEELNGLSHKQIFQLFKKFSLENVYNFEHHVRIGEDLDAKGRLPVTFMLLQPQSWHPDVWSDITRMLSLNSSQYSGGKQLHLCPLPYDIVDRSIAQWSNQGDVVYDPFVGIGTVAVRAIKLKRKGIGCELSNQYFLDAAAYCKAAEDEIAMPSFFDAIDCQDTDEHVFLGEQNGSGLQDSEGRHSKYSGLCDEQHIPSGVVHE